jgi:hypothetical protein
VVSKSFREARQDITGESWLDDLARASLSAAEAKFSSQAQVTPLLRVALPGIRNLDAHDSYLVTKAVQDATAKLAHILRLPKTETSAARASDRAKARLIQRGQAGNMILFGFPQHDEDLAPGTLTPTVETLAERAVRELVTILPSSADDDASLDAVLAQRPTVRNAVNDIANAVPSQADGLDFHLTPLSGDAIDSVLSVDQADVLKSSLSESRVDRRTITITGRLDGVRTRRRIFYLEPESGGDIHGAVDLELLESVRINLNRQVVATLHEERITALSGRRNQPLYRLINLESAPEMF